MSEEDTPDILDGPLHGESSISRYDRASKRCTHCFRPLTCWSGKCDACASGAHRTLHEVVMEYNNRNPDDRVTYKEVHSILTSVMEKLRHRARNPEFNQGEGAVLNEMWSDIL
jgi:predicted ATP-dependent serine protease